MLNIKRETDKHKNLLRSLSGWLSGLLRAVMGEVANKKLGELLKRENCFKNVWRSKKEG